MLDTRRSVQTGTLSPDAVLNSLRSVIVVVDADARILYVNSAGEHFFCSSAKHLAGQSLDHLMPVDSPLFTLIRQARAGGCPAAEYDVALENPKIGRHVVNIWASPLADVPDAIVVSMQEQSIAAKIERQLSHRGAARSVSALAAMLAHEVKNPLAGIRGAAQLLEQNVSAEDRALTRLIRDETDRVCALVDRMEVFSDGGPQAREPVNIHQVLNRVRMLVESGAGGALSIAENYDPSLPAVYGHRDQLTQVFLNLVKNAAEALPSAGGKVTITTRYGHGVRFAVPGSHARVHLPLMISIHDNGEGVPDDIKPHIFDPFVTTKRGGSGLGLALVAKIIGEHGGVIEVDSQPGRTEVRVRLPMAATNEGR
ncbi:MAG: PAS domain-containing protein [Rhodospirillales bacterium]|nr:PAS domain-containing protein [Rhodospirillales bacterium]